MKHKPWSEVRIIPLETRFNIVNHKGDWIPVELMFHIRLFGESAVMTIEDTVSGIIITRAITLNDPEWTND